MLRQLELGPINQRVAVHCKILAEITQSSNQMQMQEESMAKYRIENCIVDTENAIDSWDETTRFDGKNEISAATGSQWNHQTLYKSRKGRYYIENFSQWQGSSPSAEWVSPQEATRWLILNEHELPDDLKQYENEISE